MVSKEKYHILHLYRKILQLHRKLPSEHRFIGDNYVQDEFRRHKNVTEKGFILNFVKEWTAYYEHLSEQIPSRPAGTNNKFGRPLTQEELDSFNSEQIGQLHELWEESKKPKTL